MNQWKTLRKAAAAVLGTALTTLLTVGVLGTSGAGASSLVSVSMGTEPWIGYAPWYIAQQEGYFSKYGLKVNIVNFEEDADRNAALVAGKTRCLQHRHRPHYPVRQHQDPAVPLMLVDDSNGADAMMSVKSISTAAQLKGQTVAYEFGTTSDLLLHYYLLQHHMPFNSVKSVNVPAADAGTLLIAGKDKVVVTYQPYISEATSGPSASNVHVFFSSAQAPGLDQ